MDCICLYTLVNKSNGIKDFTTNSDYANKKSLEGYTVFANLISRKPIVYFYPEGF
jgi:hypothetical protein